MNKPHRFKKDLKELFNLIDSTISKLSEQQLLNLLEGKGKLVYQDTKTTKERKPKFDQKRVAEMANKLLAITTKAEAEILLVKEYKVKKEEVRELGKLLDVHVNSGDKKDEIIEKLIEGVVGVKVLEEVFREVNLKRSK